MPGAGLKGRAQRIVHDQSDAGGHGLASAGTVPVRTHTAWTRASTKRPATSKPVCSVISTKQVGLVTLISVM